jgi:hypothetical protein
VSLQANVMEPKTKKLKMKSIKSPGSLVVHGSNYYAFWRHNGKAICRALRDDNGAAVTARPEAEKANARLVKIVNKEIQTPRMA